jgi:hypothetical protein
VKLALTEMLVPPAKIWEPSLMELIVVAKMDIMN